MSHLNNIILSPHKIFYKNFSFQFAIKNKFGKIIDKFYSASSSIIRDPNNTDRFILNIRCVNIFTDTLGNISKINKNTCITINKVIIIDKYFNELNSFYIYPKIKKIPYNGVEDIRLFNNKDKILFIGSAYDESSKLIKVVSDVFNNNNYNCNFITPAFKTNFDWEKNWIFFENNDEIFIIYKWYPIYICKIDYSSKKLNLYKEINTPEIFFNFRGSTNGVNYDDKIWFIIHTTNDFHHKKNYIHRFVVLNKDLSVYGYSESFKFENYLVEFCIGLIINNNNFVIMYSTLDNTTKMMVLTSYFVKNLIVNLV